MVLGLWDLELCEWGYGCDDGAMVMMVQLRGDCSQDLWQYDQCKGL